MKSLKGPDALNLAVTKWSTSSLLDLYFLSVHAFHLHNLVLLYFFSPHHPSSKSCLYAVNIAYSRREHLSMHVHEENEGEAGPQCLWRINATSCAAGLID